MHILRSEASELVFADESLWKTRKVVDAGQERKDAMAVCEFWRGVRGWDSCSLVKGSEDEAPCSCEALVKGVRFLLVLELTKPGHVLRRRKRTI